VTASRSTPPCFANSRPTIRSQNAALDSLEPLITDRLADLQEGIDARRTKGARSATDLILAERGKRINDQIQAAVVDMEARYNLLLVQHSTKATGWRGVRR